MQTRGILPFALSVGFTIIGVGATETAFAQDPPPRIGPFVVDVRGVLPTFSDDAAIALSRGLSQAELPGLGLGATAGVHVYLPKIARIVVGLGGEVMISRAHADPPGPFIDPLTMKTTVSTLRLVTETFKSISPQLSLNFGTGRGWSYLSGGLGRSMWSIVPDTRAPLPMDDEVLDTMNYGGGGRWFAKKHLAFSLDVRVYQIAPTTSQLGYPSVPRTRLLVIGAGISVK